jgi:hypothetical protein
MAKVWQRLDFWAIVIAVLALGLSGVSMYYQFFYEPFRMSVSTLLPTLEESTVDPARGDTIAVRIAFANTGKRDATVSRIVFGTLEGEAPVSSTMSWLRFADGTPARVFAVKPGELVVKGVLFDPGSTSLAQRFHIRGDGEESFSSHVTVAVVTPPGEEYHVTLPGPVFRFVDGMYAGGGMEATTFVLTRSGAALVVEQVPRGRP